MQCFGSILNLYVIISQYVKMLFSRYIAEHFHRGINEIHNIIFDKPKRIKFNPKQFEHLAVNSIGHEHNTYEPESKLTVQWQQIIDCRTCKYEVVKAIGMSFFHYGKECLCGNQKIVLAGCFIGDDNLAWTIESGQTSVTQPDPLVLRKLTSEYGDMQQGVRLLMS